MIDLFDTLFPDSNNMSPTNYRKDMYLGHSHLFSSYLPTYLAVPVGTKSTFCTLLVPHGAKSAGKALSFPFSCHVPNRYLCIILPSLPGDRGMHRTCLALFTHPRSIMPHSQIVERNRRLDPA